MPARSVERPIGQAEVLQGRGLEAAEVPPPAVAEHAAPKLLGDLERPLARGVELMGAATSLPPSSSTM